MVIPKSNQELTFMKKAGIIVALAHRAAQTVIQPGITTKKSMKSWKTRYENMAGYRHLRVYTGFQLLHVYL